MTGAATLTETETAVLRHIVGGFSEKETATELQVCRQSVARHLQNIRFKAGITVMGSRRPLVLLARDLGLEPV